MIGYYVHHLGHGHRHRATAVARALQARGERVTGFSTLPPPADWPGAWIQLDADDGGDGSDLDPTVRDRLHWAPLGHRGLRSRMAEIAAWLRNVSPAAFVVDVSVEVAVLVRLHGIPVITVVGPGERGDAAHHLGFDVSDALVGCWPPEAAGMLRGVPPELAARVQPVGAVSRFPVVERPPGAPGHRVVLMSGSGGSALDEAGLELARKDTPGWNWTVLDARLGEWVEDPYAALVEADVVITHAGQNALAEVAAARTPAVVVPQERPHAEQRTTADVLARGGWPVVVADAWPGRDWSALLARAARLPGDDWTGWCDGRAAERFADVVQATALDHP